MVRFASTVIAFLLRTSDELWSNLSASPFLSRLGEAD